MHHALTCNPHLFGLLGRVNVEIRILVFVDFVSFQGLSSLVSIDAILIGIYLVHVNVFFFVIPLISALNLKINVVLESRFILLRFLDTPMLFIVLNGV